MLEKIFGLLVEFWSNHETAGETALHELIGVPFYEKLVKNELAICSKNERAFLDEIREKYEWNDHLGFPHLQRKKITKFSNIYQQDFKKSNLKELVNDTKTKAD